MKRTIRFGTFETNSSSTHTLVVCTKEEYDAWRKGETLLDRWKNYEYDFHRKDPFFVPNTEEYRNDEEGQYVTYEEYWDEEYLECFDEEYTTPSGDVVRVFGKYGYDS